MMIIKIQEKKKNSSEDNKKMKKNLQKDNTKIK